MFNNQATKKGLQEITLGGLSKAVYAKYFKPGQAAKEIQEIVRKALEMYYEHKQKDCPTYLHNLLIIHLG